MYTLTSADFSAIDLSVIEKMPDILCNPTRLRAIINDLCRNDPRLVNLLMLVFDNSSSVILSGEYGSEILVTTSFIKRVSSEFSVNEADVNSAAIKWKSVLSAKVIAEWLKEQEKLNEQIARDNDQREKLKRAQVEHMASVEQDLAIAKEQLKTEHEQAEEIRKKLEEAQHKNDELNSNIKDKEQAELERQRQLDEEARKKREAEEAELAATVFTLNGRTLNEADFVNQQYTAADEEILIPCGFSNSDYGFIITGIKETDTCRHPYAQYYALVYQLMTRNSMLRERDIPDSVFPDKPDILEFRDIYIASVAILMLIKNNGILNDVPCIKQFEERTIKNAVKLINTYVRLFSDITGEQVPH